MFSKICIHLVILVFWLTKNWYQKCISNIKTKRVDVLCQQNPKVRSINKIQVLHNNFELYFSELISISQNTIVFITNKGKMGATNVSDMQIVMYNLVLIRLNIAIIWFDSRTPLILQKYSFSGDFFDLKMYKNSIIVVSSNKIWGSVWKFAQWATSAKKMTIFPTHSNVFRFKLWLCSSSKNVWFSSYMSQSRHKLSESIDIKPSRIMWNIAIEFRLCFSLSLWRTLTEVLYG